MIGAVKSVLKADIAQGAVARYMGREQDIDVDRGTVHVFQPRLHIPIHLLPDRR
jgi:hypothetical protein